MIVISAGMQKSGTAWYFSLTNDLLTAAGRQDVHSIRRRFRLESILRYETCQMGRPTPRKLMALIIPHLCGNTFVAKTHSAPSRSLRYLMSLGVVRATYIFRDPRDVAISAFEHGQRLRREGRMERFARLSSLEEAILFAERLLPVWGAWMACKEVFCVRYEDLLISPEGTLMDLARFLSLSISPRQVQHIVAGYDLGALAEKKVLLHFNTGIAGRFRDIMTREQLDLCNERFGDCLVSMGYPVI